ncbi:hypothetical protein OK074_0356 [Actinobacteria bacterium OK074]|nr:hypothetical protein OK074_0356 [Actinobacteria bacterium OK074]
MTRHAPEVTRVVTDVDGIPFSALLCAVPKPRAVLVALHGGAVTSRYFDHPAHPELSLLRTAAALGVTVLALDRPGYGDSAPYGDTMGDPERRVDLGYAAVDRLLAQLSRGAGLFLMAHSIGCDLGVRMAADARRTDLLGVELAGTGHHRHPRLTTILTTGRPGARGPRTRAEGGGGIYDLLWEPERLYPADVVGAAGLLSPGPRYENHVAVHWPREFPHLAARVAVPVHFTLGAYEKVWRAGPEGLADIASLFTAAPRVEVAEQAEAGHNLSIGLTATAYHLKVLSFMEECVTARDNARPWVGGDTPARETRRAG